MKASYLWSVREALLLLQFPLVNTRNTLSWTRSRPHDVPQTSASSCFHPPPFSYSSSFLYTRFKFVCGACWSQALLHLISQFGPRDRRWEFGGNLTLSADHKPCGCNCTPLPPYPRVVHFLQPWLLLSPPFLLPASPTTCPLPRPQLPPPHGSSVLALLLNTLSLLFPSFSLLLA